MKYSISGLFKTTLVSAIAITVISCGGAEERKEKYLEKGKVYLEEKNYDKAKIEFKNVLQIDPKDADAYFFMGQLEERNKELVKALSNYKKAIELDPKHTKAKVKLAKIYVIAGTEAYIKDANALLNQITQEQPGNSEAELISATILYKTGSKQKAIIDLESVVNKDMYLVEGISLLATLYQSEGEEDKAQDLLTKAVENNPKEIPLHISLAKLLAKNNDYSNAEKYLKQAISIEPENYALQVALASFYTSSDQLNKAETVLRNAIKQDDEDSQRYLVLVEMLATRSSVQKAEDELINAIKNKPKIYDLKFSLVSFYEKVGKRKDAKKVLEQIISERTYEIEGVNARIQLANLLLQEGNLKSAKKHVDEVIAEYPNNSGALLITSKLALEDFDSIAAINGLRTVLKNDPKNAEASLLLAQAHELNNETSLAETELKKSIEANPVNDQAHANYTKYLLSKGRIDEAISVLDKALTYFKDSYPLMQLKLKVLASQGQDKQMLTLLNMMEQSNPNNAEINITKGQYYLAKRDFSKSIEQFEKAYEKSNNKFQPLEMMVKVYLTNQQPEKAIEMLNKRIEQSADDAIANQLLGQLYVTQNKIDAARLKFQVASNAAASWFLPYKSLALTYAAEKDYIKALEVLKSSLPKLSNVVPAMMQMASLYEVQSKYADAMSIYKQVLDENISNKLAANNYASLLLDHGEAGDVDKALELVKGFEKIQQSAFLDTLAWAYAKSSNHQRAIEILLPIVEKTPDTAIFRYHLGYALYYSGDKAAAKSHLEIAVSSEQKFTGKDEAGKLLKTI